MQEVNALARLGIWAGSSGPLLPADAISTKFSLASTYMVGTCWKHLLEKFTRNTKQMFSCEIVKNNVNKNSKKIK